MRKSALFGYLFTCFLLIVFLPRDTRGIELPNNTVLVLQNNDASIYPNPVKDNFLFQPNTDGLQWDENADLKFEIRNILGNSMPVKVERVEQGGYRFDTADYPAGYYLLMVHCSSCQEKGAKSRNAFKFLKQ